MRTVEGPLALVDTEYVCPRCANYAGGNLCRAFLNGIPTEILAGQNSHTEPYPGDNGIQFEAVKDANED